MTPVLVVTTVFIAAIFVLLLVCIIKQDNKRIEAEFQVFIKRMTATEAKSAKRMQSFRQVEQLVKKISKSLDE